MIDQFLIAVVDDVVRGHKPFLFMEKACKYHVFCLSFFMDIDVIKAKVLANEFLLSAHADHEAADENIDIAEICHAIFNGEILEEYADTGRGESCLVSGFANERPIHVVCGWRREQVVIITVYIPKPPKFIDSWTRGK
jgi:Domain of unknown function (DUF4258)